MHISKRKENPKNHSENKRG